MYAHWRTPPAEPLLLSPLPDLPWQKVATDLFKYNGKHYLIVIDYFSRYVKLVELRSETDEHVIVALKSLFARHGIPAVVCSDNGPCYAATSFQQFATAYSFNILLAALASLKPMVRLNVAYKLPRTCYAKQLILTWHYWLIV